MRALRAHPAACSALQVLEARQSVHAQRVLTEIKTTLAPHGRERRSTGAMDSVRSDEHRDRRAPGRSAVGRAGAAAVAGSPRGVEGGRRGDGEAEGDEVDAFLGGQGPSLSAYQDSPQRDSPGRSPPGGGGGGGGDGDYYGDEGFEDDGSHHQHSPARPGDTFMTE